MPFSPWTESKVEGRGLRKAFNKLLNKLNQIDDVDEIVKISNSMAYVAEKKTNIAKTFDLEQRIVQLERKVGIQ